MPDDIPYLANVAIGNRKQTNPELVQGFVFSVQSSQGCSDREFSRGKVQLLEGLY
jgi:hypothetical protein